MDTIVQWMENLPDRRFVILFQTDSNLQVKTREVTWRSTLKRRMLTRTREMEQAIWDVIDLGLTERRISEWQGLFYVMGTGQLPHFTPLYIGTVRKSGTKRAINSDLQRSKLAHWGDAFYYHIGDLSNAIYESDPSEIKPNFQRWANELFASVDNLQLKEQVYLYIAPWWKNSQSPSGRHCSLDELRNEFIRATQAKLSEER